MPDAAPLNIDAFISSARLAELIRIAKEEDLGPDGLDVTSELFVSSDIQGEASVVARQHGRLAGVALLAAVAQAYDQTIHVDIKTPDGARVEPAQVVAVMSGPMRSILAAERVALNLISHLSGVATLTSLYVQEVSGTQARVYDTRKTLPGLRGLQKYAVACGGGATHRMGLYDAVLLKDNHLAHVGSAGLGAAVTDAVKRSRAAYPHIKFVMVEVDTLDQLDAVLTTGVDIVLLDNMTMDQLKQAVNMRDAEESGVELEASGGVTLKTIGEIAKSGVDRISVGALTHSAPALDMGLDITP
jgi:nicotinate-nucleotide pyrophosphorylase (carboxylating)